ncbi:hypothetical protein BDV96DRAFT_609818 [Lophiotrema nucula]|uniref:NmrA-like domain-containing protein n=1 Tax=Lophiotrema nucula TaxID=690887 RepID=A0A6A5ZQY6_9PLEO|nr:hypothetical protein BDV96DRAFT_609818 [Lophiotrema nucula]
MSKILAIFGATGHQGSSIINFVLNDAELSQEYKIRAITRDVNTDKAKQLAGKVELVQGDFHSPSSIETALTGAHTVFAMTFPSFEADKDFDIQYNSAKAIADVAVSKGASYIIFSTLPAVSRISGGKYTKVTPFDAKAKAEQYIRGLPIKSAFVSLGSFMENFQEQFFVAPQPAADGIWILTRNHSLKTQLPLIDAVGDTGKFVGAILAEPEKYSGKTFCAAVKLYTFEEIVDLLSKSSGKTIKFKQIPDEEFKASLPLMGDVFVEGYRYGEEFGYFGPGTEELVAWAAEHARGKLTTFEEYLEEHPFQLSA